MKKPTIKNMGVADFTCPCCISQLYQPLDKRYKDKYYCPKDGWFKIKVVSKRETR